MKGIRLLHGAFFYLFLGVFCSSVSQASRHQWAGHITNFTGSMPYKAEGYKTLVYPIKVLSGADKKGFYYSQYVYFKHGRTGNGAYYMGIQPWGNGQAKVIFSVFGSDVEKQDERCTAEADRQHGSSCFAFMPFEYGVEYKFIATLLDSSPSGNTWEGYAVNTASHETRRIGAWKTPAAWGLLSGKSIGFIEHFLRVENCAALPGTTALFGAGMGSISSSGSVKGTLTTAYPAIADPCKNRLPFKSAIQSDGSLLVVQDQGIN